MTTFTSGLINVLTNMTTLADPYTNLNNATNGSWAYGGVLALWAIIFFTSSDKLSGFTTASLVSFIVGLLFLMLGLIDVYVVAIFFIALLVSMIYLFSSKY